MGQRIVYRIPRYDVGPNVFMAADVKDRLPWALRASKIPDHWKENKGEGVTVAVLDTGLWRHSDLPEPAFAANFSRSRSVFDVVGHGTHVAGTIGARLNDRGVAGWAPACNIGCVKVLGDDGSGDDDGIAKGIYFAAENGAHIINMSLGGGFSPAIAQACKDVIQQGVFLLCAAGNEGDGMGQNTVGWPARLAETIAIASYREDGQISEFSSRGPEVDMAFPGEDILSTWLNSTYRAISGTSMATPAAAGLTALMLASHKKAAAAGRPVVPLRNNRELLEHWKRHAIDAGDPGQDVAFGWGIPDYEGVIRSAPPVGPPPVPPLESEPSLPGLGPVGTLFGRIGVQLLHHQGHDGLFLFLK